MTYADAVYYKTVYYGVEIEAGDNDLVITATFKPFVEELGFNLDINSFTTSISSYIV